MPPEVKAITSRLDLGEQQAVALAYQFKKLLIIDDRLGRNAARQLGLSVTGTAGVLIRAKDAGLIPAIRPVLEEIQGQGYWLSNAFLDAAIKLAGES
jgi:predicted nucleic acid-binding protein